MASYTSSTTSSAAFNAVTSIFEDNVNNAGYSVYEITREGVTNMSTFNSKTKAFEFARGFTSSSSNVYVYKTKCIKVFDASEDRSTFNRNVDMIISAAEELDRDPTYHPDKDDEQTDNDMPELEYCLEGLKFYDYGKGYILMPASDTAFVGVKYLNDGWWNASQGGWFFLSQFYDNLVVAGAVYSTRSLPSSSSRSTRSPSSTSSSRATPSSRRQSSAPEQSSSVVTVSPFEQERDLSGFILETYGKGVIVKCNRSNSLFKNREPYLLGNIGWWNESQGGWFFQNKYVCELKRLGVKVIKQEPVTPAVTRKTRFVTSDSRFMEDEPQFERYGKGWLLRESDTYTFSDNGKYFQGGFWMPKNNGWFFRTADKESFTA